MSTSINIMRAKDVRVTAFSPLNCMALTLRANNTEVTYFDMPPEIAWSMFDMLRDGRTAFHYGEEHAFTLDEDPQAAADLIARARAATLPVMEAA